MILASLLCLALALYSYAISQLQQHGQLKWMDPDNTRSFWGKGSYARKYKNHDKEQGQAFFLSTTLLVFLTDGYHFAQFMFFNFLALGFTLAIGWNWYLFGGLMVGVRIVHWSARTLLIKK